MRQKWLSGSRISIFYLILFFSLWEAVVRIFNIPVYLLPKPSSIIVKLFANLPLILKYTWVTGFESFGGFILSAVLGVPLSLIIAFSVFLRKTLYPSTVALQLVPKIALAPLFVTWFGFGLMPKFIIVFLLCFFPILLNAILGFTSLSKELNQFSQSTGAGPMMVLW
ncbi:MAG: ABC transporter permease subunit [Desulfobacterales bacterium]